MADRKFKGGSFLNRYRITGILKTISHLNIGDGLMDSNELRVKQKEGEDVPKFSTVMTDYRNRAYIPGTTIKGNLRCWLEQIFSDLMLTTINTPKRAEDLQDLFKKNKNSNIILHDFLQKGEYLFGSSVNEGKLEFWDAPMNTPPPINQNQTLAYSGYDQTRGTILLKSVAIDPETGTAAKNRLFNYEVVPQGMTFEITVCGQNLLPDELGMLLFALDGFNSEIYPVTLGAMGGVGFGRCRFSIKEIFYLDKNNYEAWIQSAIQSGHAGYNGLPKLAKEEQEKMIEDFRKSFAALLPKKGAS
ncbi:RAMP superfamily CRISPR-associated protein [Desulfobacterium sp. N47]|uniref:CRISPR type III-associated protein domain-containing protein n=1 Tax=uncultured Desulfobacterium sp. TaxID=201089 RepID=E1YF68_9BACT|nr:hypothetical protein N47_J01930 [uncultured Desulfobacterium sp.]